MSLKVIDLFSGAGGLTEGFTAEGFDIIAHIEKEKWACETLRTRTCYHWLKVQNDIDTYYDYYIQTDDTIRNMKIRNEIIYEKYPDLKELVNQRIINKTFGNTDVDPNYISAVDAIKMIEHISKNNGNQNISVVIGGPPCQAYSLIGRGRMGEQAAKDDRNYLFHYYLDIVKAFKPKLFVFENVPGILTAKKGKIYPEIIELFSQIGYGISSGSHEDVQQNIIDCMDYGVYQTRRRVILIGYNKTFFPGGFTYPDFKRYMEPELVDELPTTENAILDLPGFHAGEGADFWFKQYDSQPLSVFQKKMRANCPGVANHRARPHRDHDLAIYKMQIQASQRGERIRYSALPDSLQFHKNSSLGYFEDRFRVHGINEVPHTIVAHIAKDGHYNIHPDVKQLRSLTVREAARIQSFTDDYLFEGPRTAQFNQVGNAVPPQLSRLIAKAVKDLLLDG